MEVIMKKLTRSLSLALICALLLPACAQDGSEQTAETTAAVADTTAIVETTADPNDRSQVKDNVPEGLTFNGESVRVLYRGEESDTNNICIYDVRGTDNIGDYVTDGVWNRNRTVEERLNITLECMPLGAGTLSEHAAKVKSIILAGSDEYDYLNVTGNTSITSGLNNYMRDLANIPYVDYDADWWWMDAIEALSLDGKTYNYIFGDSLIYCYIQTGVVYYNKTLYENAFGDPDEMYKIVMDGQWTIDKLMELTAASYSDANGDGVPNAGDIFGSMKTANQGEETPHFLQGFDLNLYTRDEEDNLIIDFDQERCVTAIEKLGQYNVNTEGVFHSDQGIDGGTGAYFVQNYSVFYPARLSRVLSADFRDMENPYGILPYPKLNEDQKDYVSLIHDSCSNICVPKTVPDAKFEVVGAALEALAAESWRSVMPMFLETALKLKYSQDSMSGQVIDMVVASVSKNTLFEYKNYCADIFTTALVNNAKAGTNNFSSAYKKLGPAAQKQWDKAVDNLEK